MKKLQTRINRVKGQLEGINRMIENGEDSSKIAMQISAAVSGMQSIKTTYMKVRMMEEIMENMSTILENIKD
ncbi:metal-sensitive transcriptional regulator [Candidatus Woesebacteria bacterium]|nr:metal-sensitive transcriptional regulator [Candidatus Woesebacteria bacterium]